MTLSPQPDALQRLAEQAWLKVLGFAQGQSRRVLRAAGVVLLVALGASGASGQPAQPVVDELRDFARTANAEVERIGLHVWRNEAGGRRDRLVHWLPGENHLSLGIGHVIWYPEGARDGFHESFPDLLAFLRQRGVALPASLAPLGPCPWRTRAEFLAAGADPRLIELRDFLARTVADQAAYLVDRLARALPALLAAAPDDGARARLTDRVRRILHAADGRISPTGVYALVDYVSFKGEGILPTERYQGEGWGLLQALEALDDGISDPRAAFAAAAAAVLTRRVALAPPERHEARWLEGWRRRVATYADDGHFATQAAADDPVLKAEPAPAVP